MKGVSLDQVPRPVRGKPRAGEFVFARLRYDSGDWDYNPKVAANVLNSIVEYTNINVYPEEVIITADSEELPAFPFLFMTGHKLVRFNDRERERLRGFGERGGFLFSDDCNHVVAGLYATSFEQEMRRVFPGPRAVEIRGRVGVLYSNKDYGCEWDYDCATSVSSATTTPSSASIWSSTRSAPDFVP